MGAELAGTILEDSNAMNFRKLYIFLVFLFAADSLSASFKNLWLKTSAVRCETALATSSGLTPNPSMSTQIERILPQSFNSAVLNKYRLYRASDVVSFIHSFQAQTIRILSPDKGSINGQTLEILGIFKERFSLEYNQLVEGINSSADISATGLSQIDSRAIQRNQSEKNSSGEFARYVEGWRVRTSGLLGELMAALSISNLQGMEVHVKNILSEEEFLKHGKSILYRKVRNLEMDMVANNRSHWYEIKYLTEGYGRNKDFEGKLRYKLQRMNEFLEIYNETSKTKVKFSLVIYGPGKLHPLFVREIKSMKNIDLKFSPPHRHRSI